MLSFRSERTLLRMRPPFRLVRLSLWTLVLPVLRPSRPLRCKLKLKLRQRLRLLKLAALVVPLLNSRLIPLCLLKHRHKLKLRRRLRSKPKLRRRLRLRLRVELLISKLR